MERINFTYCFEDNGTEHSVLSSKRNKEDEGLHCDDICEMFVDFMRSAGFSEQNIYDYFRDDCAEEKVLW